MAVGSDASGEAWVMTRIGDAWGEDAIGVCDASASSMPYSWKAEGDSEWCAAESNKSNPVESGCVITAAGGRGWGVETPSGVLNWFGPVGDPGESPQLDMVGIACY